MSTRQGRVIIDDNAGDVQYTGGEWTLSTIVQWYQATSNYPAFVTGTTFGSLSFSFEGRSAAFIGNIPPPDFFQFASVSIDGSPFINTSYGYSAPPAYVQWYQTPTLSDGAHTIKMGYLDSTAVDMIIVTVGPNTSLAGKKIFIDNNDPSIHYTGNWAQNKNGFLAGSLPDGLPVGNTTQQSTTPGDYLTFRFSGTSVAIFGIFSWTNIGGISVTYTLDGNIETFSYSVTASSPEHINGVGQATNFLFYEKDNLSPTAHELIMNITNLQNQPFLLDYIVYSPSFSSFATMPNLTAISTSTTTASTIPSGSTSTPNSTVGVPTPAGKSGNYGDVPVGVVVGGVLGGLTLLVMIWIALFCRRRTRPLARESRRSQNVQGHLVDGDDDILQTTNVIENRRPFSRRLTSRPNVTPFRLPPPPTVLIVSSPEWNGEKPSCRTTIGYGTTTNNTVPSPLTANMTSAGSSSTRRQHSFSLPDMPSNISGAALNESSNDIPELVPPAYDALSIHGLLSDSTA